jgi:transposase
MSTGGLDDPYDKLSDLSYSEPFSSDAIDSTHINEKLRKVEGVGPLVATAVIAAIGNARQFTNGRELSAWLGLVPREHSSGNRTMLLGISKRGNRYLRTLLIHGARAAARVAERKRDARSIWLSRLKLRGGPNVAAVALANKNARVLWALLARGDSYRVRPAMDRESAA